VVSKLSHLIGHTSDGLMNDIDEGVRIRTSLSRLRSQEQKQELLLPLIVKKHSIVLLTGDEAKVDRCRMC
jgi:hypothetical protein